MERGVRRPSGGFAQSHLPGETVEAAFGDLFSTLRHSYAHTTFFNSDALWVELPSSRSGPTFAARVAEKFSQCGGLPELVTGSPAEMTRKWL